MNISSLQLVFGSILLASMLSCSNGDGGKSSPTPQTPPNKPVDNGPSGGSEEESGDLTLVEEVAILTEPLQQFKTNFTAAENVQKYASVKKSFLLTTSARFAIKLDNEITTFTDCKSPLAIEYEVKLSSPSGLIDLRKVDSAIIEVNTEYAVHVKIDNSGNCNGIKYGFSLVAKRIADPVTPQPAPTLPERVTCYYGDRLLGNMEGCIQFNLVNNSIQVSKGADCFSYSDFFSTSVACGFKPQIPTVISCDPNYRFNGQVYQRSFSCTGSNGQGGAERQLGRGSISFNLENGEGQLNCSVLSTLRKDLRLRRCSVSP